MSPATSAATAITISGMPVASSAAASPPVATAVAIVAAVHATNAVTSPTPIPIASASMLLARKVMIGSSFSPSAAVKFSNCAASMRCRLASESLVRSKSPCASFVSFRISDCVASARA